MGKRDTSTKSGIWTIAFGAVVLCSVLCFIFLRQERQILMDSGLEYEMSLPELAPVDTGGIEDVLLSLLWEALQYVLPFI